MLALQGFAELRCCSSRPSFRILKAIDDIMGLFCFISLIERMP
jgi:hypothetical protein